MKINLSAEARTLLARTMDTDMSTPDKRGTDRANEDSITQIESNLDSLITELDDALELLADRDDVHEIVRALTAAVIVQEMGRMTVTKTEMVAGDLDTIDAVSLLSDWEVLARHYSGAKHQGFLEQGAAELKKLDPEKARRVIHEIRGRIEPTINWAMQEETMKLGIEIPFLKKTGLGRFSLNFSGAHITMQRFQSRAVRFVVQCGLWLAVAFGLVHWASWTIFDTPYLLLHLEGAAKLAQFVLLLATTLVAWVIAIIGRKYSRPGSKRISIRILTLAAWLIVAVGWCHLVLWFFAGIPSVIPGLDEATQLLLPFFLISGSIAAWLSGRIFGDDESGDE